MLLARLTLLTPLQKQPTEPKSRSEVFSVWFSPEANHFQLQVPDGMIREDARKEIGEVIKSSTATDTAAVEPAIQAKIDELRGDKQISMDTHY